LRSTNAQALRAPFKKSCRSSTTLALGGGATSGGGIAGALAGRVGGFLLLLVCASELEAQTTNATAIIAHNRLLNRMHHSVGKEMPLTWLLQELCRPPTCLRELESNGWI
jgi:hypothetical protein